MKRTKLNSLVWALIISLFPFYFSYWIYDSYLGLVTLPISYFMVLMQPYIFYKNGHHYFRGKPFKKAHNVRDIKNRHEIEVVFESQENIALIWKNIKELQLTS